MGAQRLSGHGAQLFSSSSWPTPFNQLNCHGLFFVHFIAFIGEALGWRTKPAPRRRSRFWNITASTTGTAEQVVVLPADAVLSCWDVCGLVLETYLAGGVASELWNSRVSRSSAESLAGIFEHVFLLLTVVSRSAILSPFSLRKVRSRLERTCKWKLSANETQSMRARSHGTIDAVGISQSPRVQRAAWCVESLKRWIEAGEVVAAGSECSSELAALCA